MPRIVLKLSSVAGDITFAINGSTVRQIDSSGTYESFHDSFEFAYLYMMNNIHDVYRDMGGRLIDGYDDALYAEPWE